MQIVLFTMKLCANIRETRVSRSLAPTDQRRKRQLILARTMLLWTPDVKSVDNLTTLTTTYLLSQPDHPLFIANTITMDNTITLIMV